MANITIPALTNFAIQGDGVATVAGIWLPFVSSTVSMSRAYQSSLSGPIDVSSNIASVSIVGTYVTINFVTPFSYLLNISLSFTLTPAIQLVDAAGVNVLSVTTAGAVKTDGSAVTQPVSAASLPLPTGASTLSSQATEILALATLVTNSPALASGRVPVDGSGVTQPVSGAVSVSNFPATQPVSAAALPLPTGAATSANQPAPVAKGKQGATATPTQDLKDSGRTYVSFTALAAAGVTSEALLSMSQNKQGTVTTGVTSYVITSGNTLRITSIGISVRSGNSSFAFSRLALRHNTAGATIVTSPIAYLVPEAGTENASSGAVGSTMVNFSDGIEFYGNGTQTIGVSHLDQRTDNILNVTVYGYEY